MKKNKYKKFLNKNKDKVFSYAVYFLHCWEDAEDITQEVFMKLWNNWYHINPQKRESWIMRVTHNCCIDLLRKRKKMTQTADIDIINSKNLSDHTDIFSNPEKQYHLTEQQKIILSAMAKLPKKQQNVLILYYFYDKRIKEISNLLEIKESTLKVILHRARKSMKTLLSEYFYEKKGGQYEFAV
ncbi:MAG: sigma-70 family RNA polymerase sigma factor [bacterium]